MSGDWPACQRSVAHQIGGHKGSITMTGEGSAGSSQPPAPMPYLALRKEGHPSFGSAQDRLFNLPAESRYIGTLRSPPDCPDESGLMDSGLRRNDGWSADLSLRVPSCRDVAIWGGPSLRSDPIKSEPVRGTACPSSSLHQRGSLAPYGIPRRFRRIGPVSVARSRPCTVALRGLRPCHKSMLLKSGEGCSKALSSGPFSPHLLQRLFSRYPGPDSVTAPNTGPLIDGAALC